MGDIQQAEFFASGLESENAARTVENELKAVDGVEDVEADHEASRIAVRYDIDETSPDDLGRVVERAGYEID